MFRYNSYHKLITVGLVVGWAIFHFSQRSSGLPSYANGQPKRVGNTESQLNEGKWLWYHDNGVVSIKGYFHKGKKEGLWQWFDKQGRLLSERNYKNDQLNGYHRDFDTSGNVILKHLYKNDALIE